VTDEVQFEHNWHTSPWLVVYSECSSSTATGIHIGTDETDIQM
jgi:hypothetical protein